MKKIEARLRTLDVFQQAYKILFYVSFLSEVQTHQLIKEALKNKKVGVPLVNNKELLIKEITDFSQLSPGHKNILEPSSDLPDLKVEDLNLIIVPGVAFDKKHYRLGYGGGYYDRLLAKDNDHISIGLAFEEQIVDDLPIESHDQKVDFIVTDKRVL